MNEAISEIYQGALLGMFILAMTGIIWWKTYPKEMEDLK